MTIQEIIQASGLSLAAFAREIGCPYRTVQDWAAGKRIPPQYVVNLIAEHFHIAASD